MEKEIIGSDESGFYMFLVENQSHAFVSLFPILEKYDYNLNQIYSEKICLPKKDSSIKPVDIFYQRNLITIDIINKTPLVTFELTNESDIAISAMSLNNKGTINKTLGPLINIPGGINAYDYEWKVRTNKDNTALSLFTYTFATKNDSAVIQYISIDENSKKTDEQSFTINYSCSTIDFVDFHIDNNNNIYILAKLFGGEYPVYKLFSYYSQDKKLIETEINNEKKYIRNIKLFSPKNGSPIIFGFIGDGGKNGAEGFFTMKTMGQPNENKKVIYKAFDKELLSEILTEKSIQKDPTLANLFIKDIIETNDNSYIIVAERQVLSIKNYLLYGSIITIKTDTSGIVKWWHGIYKSQERSFSNSSPPGSSIAMQSGSQAQQSYYKTIGKDYTPFYSFTSFLLNNELTILYNDNIKNKTSIKLEDLKTSDEKSTNRPVIVKFLENGDYRKELFASEEEFGFRPKLSFYSNKTGLITYRRERKRYRFGTIQF